MCIYICNTCMSHTYVIRVCLVIHISFYKCEYNVCIAYRCAYICITYMYQVIYVMYINDQQNAEMEYMSNMYVPHTAFGVLFLHFQISIDDLVL